MQMILSDSLLTPTHSTLSHSQFTASEKSEERVVEDREDER